VDFALDKESVISKGVNPSREEEGKGQEAHWGGGPFGPATFKKGREGKLVFTEIGN